MIWNVLKTENKLILISNKPFSQITIGWQINKTKISLNIWIKFDLDLKRIFIIH